MIEAAVLLLRFTGRQAYLRNADCGGATYGIGKKDKGCRTSVIGHALVHPGALSGIRCLYRVDGNPVIKYHKRDVDYA